MPRERIELYNKKRRKTTKSVVRKHIVRRNRIMKTCLLEIQVSGGQNNTIICEAPIVRVRIPKRIDIKGVRKSGTYRVVGYNQNSEWKIIRGSSPFRTLNGLINSKILVSNGKRVVKGTIVRANIVGGGVTSPPTGGGLPPVDE